MKDNTSLVDDKSIVDEFSNSMNSEYDSESRSVFLFRVNIQRGEYLKGKFALLCRNYNDALFYFIRAAKKKCIVFDGLIQQKSLKKIIKVLKKIYKKYDEYGIIKWHINKKFEEYEKSKIYSSPKKSTPKFKFNNYSEEKKTFEIKFKYTFEKEMNIIKKEIIEDLNECNVKQAKDIIIMIDFNIYTQINNNNENNENNEINIQKIDAFIDQTKTILDNYLSSKDRLSVFIYTNQYQIICPLIGKNHIDINSFTKDLIYYKKSIFHEKEESEDIKEEISEKDLQRKNIEIKSVENNNFSDSGSIGSFMNKENKFKINDIVKGLVDSLNYSKNYLKMKEEIKNEKYIILFTDLFNNFEITNEKIYDNFKNLESEKNIIFLLVGKNKTKEIKKDMDNDDEEEEDEEMIDKLILKKFDERSEIINFENMKKIKTILSSNNVIKDEIIYPNEIY